MTSWKSRLSHGALRSFLTGAMLWTLSFAGSASAQSSGTIDAGTTVTVRTNEDINASNGDGRVFSGIVEQDVFNRSRNVAIPKGANVELLVKNISKNQVALDLESITVNGRRYGIQTQDSTITSQPADGLGANKRTGEFLGGGAAIGALIGAIIGGGKGAAIGGGIGAAGGAGAQVLTRGTSVNVPAESLVSFRLQQPLQVVAADNGITRDGQHYHPGYSGASVNSAAYRDGLQAGRSDSDRNLSRNLRSNRWSSGQQLSDYQAGYGSGYDRASTGSSAQTNGYPKQQVSEGLCVYDRPNYQGREQCWSYGTDLTDLSRAGNWNDKISSIRVFGGSRSAMYRDAGFRGQSIAVDRDIPNLAQIPGQGFRSWDRQISSIRF